MNEEPTNPPTTNDAFTGQSGPQTNPFSGDLKGEFASDFGTNTNAVSQIFKSSGFGSGDRTKPIIIGVVVFALAVAGYFIFSPSDDQASDDLFTEEEGFQQEESASEQEGEDFSEEESLVEGEEDIVSGEEPAEEGFTEDVSEVLPEIDTGPGVEEAPIAEGSTGSISIVEPADGAQQGYDETMGPAAFRWDGPADRIYFSRSSSMSPLYKSVGISGGSSYSFDNPHPGRWFWQVQNESGRSDVRSFSVESPARRTFPIVQPQPGGALAGTGGVVSWQLGEKVARYKVEMVPQGSSWATPSYSFGTSGNSVQVNGVAGGAYSLRVGAFSEVSGRWEWQEVQGGVTVQ